jgi:2',3'-cyclic-nucleotide 2'-phosphodiesterase (5'-nucleotidase family)
MVNKPGWRIGGGALAALVALIAANGLVQVNGQAVSLRPQGSARSPMSAQIPPALFQDWPNQKPEFVLILTGQQHSYLKFCGCTERQLGGFERRYNFITKLRERGWPVLAVDLGDLAEHRNSTPPAQTILKYDTAIRALAALQYSGIAIGELDFELPLDKGTSNTVLQNPSGFPTLLCASLADRDVQFPGLLEATVVVGGQQGVPRIGITSVVGPSVAKRIEAATGNLKFTDSKSTLTAALDKMAVAKAEFRVLLYQGDYEAARILAGAPNIDKKVDPTFADKFDVILCLSDQEEPPAKQDQDVLGRTTISRVGHRGRYIGMMGVFRSGQPANPFLKRFQIVEMSEDYETDKDKEADNPILKILQDYAKEVRDQKFITQVRQMDHPLKLSFPKEAVVFVGSDKCNSCHSHKKECSIWEAVIPGSKKKHSHAKAFEALAKYAKKPSLREFDPDCVNCHTIGYGFKGGYFGEADARLKNVGCESCHGPGSLHVSNQNNPAYYPSLSPWKSSKDDVLPSPAKLAQGFNNLNPQEQQIHKKVNDLCQKCHDTDNDPTFRFETFWPRIQHGRGKEPVMPPPPAAAALPPTPAAPKPK